MILPFVLTPTTSTYVHPFSTTDNAILAQSGVSSQIPAFGLTTPPYGFRIRGMWVRSTATAEPSFGLYNGSTFYELFRFNGCIASPFADEWWGQKASLWVPVGSGYLPVFTLQSGSGTISGMIEIDGMRKDAPQNVIT